MTAPGGAGEWDDDTQPATVRMPTARPAPDVSGVFEIVRPTQGVLRDGVLWAPDPRLVPPGEIRGPSLYWPE